MMESSFAALTRALEPLERVVVTTHVVPDGDAIGSALALWIGLSRLGIESDVVVSGSISRRFDFLDPQRRVYTHPGSFPPERGATYDGVVVVDTSDWNRIGTVADLFAPGVRKICIDHHAAAAPFADVSVARTDATAAAEIVHDFLCDERGLSLDRELALPIYVALATETGGFAHSNTTARCHRLAAACLEQGIEPAEVHALLDRRQVAALRLAARALDSLGVGGGGKVAWVALGPADFSETRTGVDDTAGLVDYPRSLDGVEVALLLFEDEPGSTKVSFRSKSVVDVNALARRVGGGGHSRAAGAKLQMGIEEARDLVVGLAREAVEASS